MSEILLGAELIPTVLCLLLDITTERDEYFHGGALLVASVVSPVVTRTGL